MGATAEAALLRDGLLSMDIADALQRSREVAESSDRVAGLRQMYRSLGLTPTDAELAEGIAAFDDKRFDHVPPKPGPGLWLARLYVERRRWQMPVLAVVVALVLGVGGYYFVYKPYRLSQAEQARVDLEQRLPAQMDALYQAIFEETKVQQAVVLADGLRASGKAAASKGDRAGAQAAINKLEDLKATLQLDYTLRVVDRPGGKWGFWTFPEHNTDATNYFIVVEARDSSGNAVPVPITDEPSGRIDAVSTWALQVPESVYRAVAADKDDDGVVQHNLVGAKSFGFLEPEYTIGVLDGAVTRW
jgi:uncharacterized protein DUF6384